VTVKSRRLTLFLIEDQKLTFEIPLQRDEVQQRVNLFKDVWSSDKLAIETDGTLICIPWSSIKYAHLEPIEDGDVLPSPVLKGLKLID
jgi:hypothetical protein